MSKIGGLGRVRQLAGLGAALCIVATMTLQTVAGSGTAVAWREHNSSLGGEGATPRQAARFESVKVEVHDGQELTMRCRGLDVRGRDPFLFYGYSIHHIDDPWFVQNALARIVPVTSSVGVAAQAGSVVRADASVSTLSHFEWTGQTIDRHVIRTVPGTTILRAMWTGWNATMTCDLLLDGEPVPPRLESTERAVLLQASDFDGGISMSSYAYEAAVGSVYSRATDGYLFALMVDLRSPLRPPTLEASYWIDEPDGQRWTNAYIPPCGVQCGKVWIRAQTTGTWRYGVDTCACQALRLAITEITE